jgi:hypothetical protein
MALSKAALKPAPTNLASLIRGLYGRVAKQLKVDPSYVSRVARGERQSEEIEMSLEKELRRIMSMVGNNHNGHKQHSEKRVKLAPKKKKRSA